MRLKQFAKPKWVGVSSHSQLGAASPRRARVGLSLLWRCCSSPKRVFFSGLLLLAALYSAVVAPIATAQVAESLRVFAPARVVSGANFTVTLAALDAAGDVIPSHDLSAAMATASVGTLSLVSQTANTLTLQLRGVLDNESAILTVMEGAAIGTNTVTVNVETTALSVSAPATVTSGVIFALTVTGVDADGATDTDYTLLTDTGYSLSAAPGTSADLSQTGNELSVRVRGVPDGATATLTVAAEGLSGTAVVAVDVVATALSVSAPATVVSGQLFTLTVTGGVDADSATDTDYSLSATAMVTASTGTLLPVTRTPTGNGFVSLSLSGVSDGDVVMLTVTDGNLSGTADVAVDVVATALTLSAPATVVSDVSFVLTVTGVDADGAIDTGYNLPAGVQVRGPTGVALTLKRLGRTGNSFTLRLSGTNDGRIVTLTVQDSVLSFTGMVDVKVDVVATALTVSAPATVVSGTSFTLTVTGKDSAGETDIDYRDNSLSNVTVTASPGMLTTAQKSTGFELRLSGLADGTGVTLTATDSVLSSADTAAVAVDVVATALTVSAPATVVSGQSFTLTVTAVDANDATDTDYSLSTATVTASPGAIADLSQTGNELSLSLSGVSDAETAMLTATVTADGLSGTAAVMVDVVATALTVSAPATVTSGVIFALTVTGVDADGAIDTGYSLSNVTVGASTGMLTTALTSTGFELRLSEVTSGTIVTLTTTDSVLVSTDMVDVRVQAAAASLMVDAPATVVSGADFTVQLTALDAGGNAIPSHDLSAVMTTASVGTLSLVSRTADTLTLQLRGVSDSESAILTVMEGDAIGTDTVTVDVVATALSVSAPATVVSGASFALTVTGVDADDATDTDYSLSTATVSAAPGAIADLSQTGDELSLSLSGVTDAETATLTVAADGLSGTVDVTVDVVATALSVSAPATVVSGQSFTLTVTGVDANDATDTGYSLSATATVTASAGTLLPVTRTPTGNGFVGLSLSGVSDGDVVTLTVTDGELSSVDTAAVAVDVVATALSVSAPATVVSGASFALTVTGVDAGDATDTDYSLSATATVTASAGTLLPVTRTPTGNGFVGLSLSGVSDGDVVTLTVTDGVLSSADTAAVAVDVVATALSVSAPATVVSGQSFTLTVTGVDANDATDTGYSLSTATVSAAPGTIADLSQTGNELSVSVSGVTDGATATLTVAADGLSGTAAVAVDVVATALSVSAPATVVSGASFALTVTGVDANDATDTGYSLSTAAVSAAPGTIADLSQTGNELSVSVSGVTDGATATLTVAADGLSGTAVVAVDVMATALSVSAPATVVSGQSFTLTVTGVDANDATDTGYSLSTATVSAAPGTIADPSQTGNELSVSVSGVTDGATATLTVTAAGLSGTVDVKVNVVATALTVSAPATVTSGVIFALTVTGVDADGAIDTGYSLSNVTVGASTGMLTTALTSTGFELRLSEVTSGTIVTLTATDSVLVSTDMVDVRVQAAAVSLMVDAPATVVSGADFTVQLTALDAGGNAIPSHDLSAVTTTASVGTLSLVSRTADTLTLQLRGVSDSESAILTVMEGDAIGTDTVTVNVVATALSVSALATVTSGVIFTLTVTGVDADDATDTGYSLSTATVSAAPGTIADLSQTGNELSVSVSGVTDGATATLTVAADGLSGTAAVAVDVVATALSVSAPATVVSGASFALTVTGVDAGDATDTGYSLSATATVTASAGTLLPVTRTPTGNGFIGLSLSGVSDGDVVTVTVTADGLSGTADVAVDVVATALSVSAPATVVSGQLFTLTVTGVDANDATDTGYSLSTATVSAAPGAIADLSQTGNELSVSVSGVTDGATATLTVAADGLSGTAAVAVDVVATALSVSAPATVVSGQSFTLTVTGVDANDATDTGYSLSTATVSAAPGTLVEESSTATSIGLRLSGVSDGDVVTVTVTADGLSGTADVAVDVVATALSVSAPATVVSGASFALTVTGVDANDATDTGYSLSTAAVSASPGTIADLSQTGNELGVSVSGVTDGATATLTVAADGLSGTAVVAVDVVATALSVSAPATVVSGQSFTLTVTGVDANDATDTGYSLSTATVSAAPGAIADQSQTGDELSLSLSGVTDGAVATLTVAADGLSGTVDVTVDVVATALRLVASQDPVNRDTSFTLTVTAVDAAGATDTGYSLSASATVTASAGTLVEDSRAATSIELRLSGVSDGDVVTLTVTDGVLSSTLAVTVTARNQLDIDLDDDVDQTDALMMFRTLGFTESFRTLIKNGTFSGVVVAGIPALIDEELNIIERIEALEASSNSVLDIDLDGDVDQTDALMMFRTLGFTASFRTLIKNGTFSGVVVAGIPALIDEELNIIVRIEQRAGL